MSPRLEHTRSLSVCVHTLYKYCMSVCSVQSMMTSVFKCVCVCVFLSAIRSALFIYTNIYIYSLYTSSCVSPGRLTVLPVLYCFVLALCYAVVLCSIEQYHMVICNMYILYLPTSRKLTLILGVIFRGFPKKIEVSDFNNNCSS